MRNNMYDAVALLSDTATATKAEELVGLFLEDLDGVDYNKVRLTGSVCLWYAWRGVFGKGLQCMFVVWL